MANKPCFGLMTCPYCRHKNAVFWNGNTKTYCHVCKRKFKVSRQKLTAVQLYKGDPPA